MKRKIIALFLILTILLSINVIAKTKNDTLIIINQKDDILTISINGKVYIEGSYCMKALNNNGYLLNYEDLEWDILNKYTKEVLFDNIQSITFVDNNEMLVLYYLEFDKIKHLL